MLFFREVRRIREDKYVKDCFFGWVDVILIRNVCY